MDQNAAKLAVGLFLLVAIWIAVYWVWDPSGPGISYQRHVPDIPDSKVSGSSAELPELPPAPSGPTEVDDPGAPIQLAPTKPAPPRAEVPKATVVPPEFVEYEIKPGDSFASIARKFFGPAGRGETIARANPLKDPRRLRPGEKIRVPRDPANIQGKPATAHEALPSEQVPAGSTPATYTVRSGDTLGEISTAVYGTSQRADDILRANRDQLSKPEDLRPGQVLKLPPR